MSQSLIPEGKDEVRIVLPWPDKDLSPNGRANPFAKARKTKAAREAAYYVTRQALGRQRSAWTGVVFLHWDFRPKTRNKVDDDNAEGSCKAYRDGIAQALGIDDSNFKATRSIGEPVKGGAVLVTVREA